MHVKHKCRFRQGRACPWTIHLHRCCSHPPGSAFETATTAILSIAKPVTDIYATTHLTSHSLVTGRPRSLYQLHNGASQSTNRMAKGHRPSARLTSGQCTRTSALTLTAVSPGLWTGERRNRGGCNGRSSRSARCGVPFALAEQVAFSGGVFSAVAGPDQTGRPGSLRFSLFAELFSGSSMFCSATGGGGQAESRPVSL